MALTRLSPGVYRDAQGKTVYSKDGKTASSAPGGGGGKPGAPKGAPKTPKGVANVAVQGAGNVLAGSGVGQAFNPEVSDRNTGFGFEGAQQIADRAFAALDQDITAREQRDREAMTQQLANRGININNPNDPTYRAFMDDFERKFSRERQQAQDQAYQQGISGLESLLKGQELVIGNQYGNAAGVTNQNLAQIKALLDAAMSAQGPGFKQQELSNQKLAASKVGSGGAAPKSPFNNAPMPGAQPRK